MLLRAMLDSLTNLCFIGVLSDATKSVSRAYINNFQDKAKQQAIDLFLVFLFLLFCKLSRLLTFSKGQSCGSETGANL
jgi:hypothetical protein